VTSQAIRRLTQAGSRFDTPIARIYYAPAEADSPGLACVVGKKVHAHAVVRHRYQRLLRECLHALTSNLPSYDMVVVAKPAILRVKKRSELQQILEPYFEKLSANNVV